MSGGLTQGMPMKQKHVTHSENSIYISNEEYKLEIGFIKYLEGSVVEEEIELHQYQELDS